MNSHTLIISKAIDLVDDYVIVIRDKDLLVWEMPDLYPPVHPLSNDMSDKLEPIWRCYFNGVPVHPVSGGPFPCSVNQLDNWYTNLGYPIHFDVFLDLGLVPQSLPSIYRYQLDIPNLVNPDFKLTRTATFSYRFEGNLNVFSSRIYQGKIFVNHFLDGKFLAHCHDPSQSVGHGLQRSISLIEMNEDSDSGQQYVCHATCPSSGRIFAATASGDKIVLLDLLPHCSLGTWYRLRVLTLEF